MKIAKLMSLAALLVFGVSQADADQTNVVQNLGIILHGVQTGGPVTTLLTVTTGVSPASIGTQQIIQALGTASAIPFSNAARLVLVTPLGGGFSSIQVRDRRNTVDVTPFFDFQQMSDFVSGSVSNILTHKTVNVDYSIQRFALHNSGSASLSVHLDVSGFASETSLSGLPGVSNLGLRVSGSGDVDGNLVILKGSIQVEGSKLEVVAGGSGPAT